MKRYENSEINIIKLILGIFVIASFIFFIWGELALPVENSNGSDKCTRFESEWVQILEDGNIIDAKVPGKYSVERGDWVTLETNLKGDLEHKWLCFRSLQHEFKIYVDGELRKEYSTLDTQLFGKTSTIAYVFMKINDDDVGKVLRVEFASDSHYSGVMDEIFVGERTDIMAYLVKQYLPSTIIAALMFLLGAGVVIASVLIWLFYKRKMEILPLGVAIVLASTWLLAESRLRQFFFPNSTLAMYMGFFMIMLLPYPFLSYINHIQKGRYQKAHMLVLGLSVVNSGVCTILQVFNIKDFFETMTSSHVILIATIMNIFVTIMLDIKNKYVYQYRAVAIGFAGIVVAGVFEVMLSYIVDTKLNGIALCISIVILLLSAVMKSGKDMLRIERDKQMAIASSESKAQFLANMSHEIRTPINTMLGMNEMILRENEDDKIAEYAHYVDDAGNMLLGIINDILDFSKIEAGKLELVECDYSLKNMLRNVEIGISNLAKAKKLEFNVEIEDELPAILKGDEIRIKQILNNLLSNAVKYTEKGSVTFSVKGINEKDSFTLLISVTDTGIGIREEDRKNMFQSFSRLELMKTRNINGTGLGLCITKQLVEKMKGTIDVTSEYGKGSCFTVSIPQEVVSIKEPDNWKAEGNETTVEPLYAPDAQVLVVDDNEVNLVVARSLLKRTAVKLDCVKSGKECLEITRNKKYDLILMDHMMPELDGIETLHLLKADKDNINCNTDVIVLTANAIAGVAEEYRKAGFSDYLSKPMKVAEAERMLKKYLL